ncbi:MAG: sulfonate ABC transporter substrate-binding protein, partial [Reyranella sp.]
MIKRRHILMAVPGTVLAAPAIAQTSTRSGAGKARELRFGYQRSGTLLIAKQQGVLEKRLNPLGID